MELRAYQKSIYEQVVNSDDNLLVQLDTGAGKTPIIAKVAKHYVNAVIVCHRNILVKQASEKLAMCGIEHRIIAGREIKKISAVNNLIKTGRHHVNPRAHIVVLSIDTFISRYKREDNVLRDDIKIVLIDEAHHFAEDNKWDTLKEVAQCRCVGFTATPVRGDGQPLIKVAGGFFDRIVQAEGYEENGTERFIEEGYLSQYSAYYAKCEKRKSNQKQVALADKAVNAYIKFGSGKQALVVHPRILNAEWSCAEFKEAGISAAVIHSGIPQYEIDEVLAQFAQKNIKVLIAVDMVNEGFDVPDCEILILARRVASFGLYRQLCGRVLRPAKNKHALIVDLNGDSIAQHGLPSDPVDWNQRQGVKRRLFLTCCTSCGFYFKPSVNKCPKCAESQRADGRGLTGHLEEYFFTADMVRAARNRIRRNEAEEMRQDLVQKELERHQNSYLEFSNAFTDDLVGSQLSLMFDALKAELKQELTCTDYNNFFIKNHNESKRVEFYSSASSKIWKSDTKKAVLTIYEKYR